MAEKHLRCLTSLVIREMQIKLTLRFNLIPVRMAEIKNTRGTLKRMWNKGNTPPLLVGVQTFPATLEVSVVIPQKTGDQPTTSLSCTALGHIPRGCSITPQGHLLNYVHGSFICNIQNLETIIMSLY